MELNVLLSAAQVHAEKDSANTSSTVSESIQDLKMLQRIVERFHNLAVDATEIACLKAAVLFKPGT